MKRMIFLCTVAIVVYATTAPIYLTSCSLARDGGILQAEKAYSAGDYKKAFTELGAAENVAAFTEKQKPYITFLRASSLEGMGEKELAKGMYQYLVDKYPASEYAASAREKLKKNQQNASPNQPANTKDTPAITTPTDNSYKALPEKNINDRQLDETTELTSSAENSQRVAQNENKKSADSDNLVDHPHTRMSLMGGFIDSSGTLQSTGVLESIDKNHISINTGTSKGIQKYLLTKVTEYLDSNGEKIKKTGIKRGDIITIGVDLKNESDVAVFVRKGVIKMTFL